MMRGKCVSFRTDAERLDALAYSRILILQAFFFSRVKNGNPY